MANRNRPDYVGDRFSARMLAKNIERYWWTRGFTDVRVWTETILLSPEEKIYVVRSNLQLKAG